MDHVYVFHGARGRFTSGVFTSVDTAALWIEKHGLTGVLTRSPIDQGAYDWAVENDLFEPKKPEHQTPEFIQKFTTASQEHYHFENGLPESG